MTHHITFTQAVPAPTEKTARQQETFEFQIFGNVYRLNHYVTPGTVHVALYLPSEEEEVVRVVLDCFTDCGWTIHRERGQLSIPGHDLIRAKHASAAEGKGCLSTVYDKFFRFKYSAD